MTLSAENAQKRKLFFADAPFVYTTTTKTSGVFKRSIIKTKTLLKVETFKNDNFHRVNSKNGKRTRYRKEFQLEMANTELLLLVLLLSCLLVLQQATMIEYGRLHAHRARNKTTGMFFVGKSGSLLRRRLGRLEAASSSCFWVASSIMHARSPSCKLSVHTTPIMGVVNEMRNACVFILVF